MSLASTLMSCYVRPGAGLSLRDVITQQLVALDLADHVEVPGFIRGDDHLVALFDFFHVFF